MTVLEEWPDVTSKVQQTADKVQQTADDTKEQLLALRAQIESLLNDRVTPALADAAEKAGNAVYTARDVTSSTADNVSKRVRGRPLIAVAISGSIGYLLGRIAR